MIIYMYMLYIFDYLAFAHNGMGPGNYRSFIQPPWLSLKAVLMQPDPSTLRDHANVFAFVVRPMVGCICLEVLIASVHFNPQSVEKAASVTELHLVCMLSTCTVGWYHIHSVIRKKFEVCRP